MIEKRPRNFEMVWTDDGISVKGAHFFEAIFFEGQWVRNDMHSLKDVVPEALTPYIDLAFPALLSERDNLRLEANVLRSEVQHERQTSESLKASCKAMSIELADMKLLVATSTIDTTA